MEISAASYHNDDDDDEDDGGSGDQSCKMSRIWRIYPCKKMEGWGKKPGRINMPTLYIALHCILAGLSDAQYRNALQS